MIRNALSRLGALAYRLFIEPPPPVYINPHATIAGEVIEPEPEGWRPGELAAIIEDMAMDDLVAHHEAGEPTFPAPEHAAGRLDPWDDVSPSDVDDCPIFAAMVAHWDTDARELVSA